MVWVADQGLEMVLGRWRRGVKVDFLVLVWRDGRIWAAETLWVIGIAEGVWAAWFGSFKGGAAVK